MAETLLMNEHNAFKRAYESIIGRAAAVPAHVHGRGVSSLKLDLTDATCLQFEVPGATFAVSHEGMRALLDAYASAMRRREELVRNCVG